MSLSLAFVNARVSSVLPFPLEDVWAVVRDWSNLRWIPHVDGRPVAAIPQESGASTSVGSVRQVRIGEQQWHERLIGLDDEEHVMKWRLISHPDTRNPFTASFVNFMATLRIEDITIGGQTYIDWRGEFFTEHEHSDGMKVIFERWFTTSISSLQEYVAQKRSHQTSQAASQAAHNQTAQSMSYSNGSAPPKVPTQEQPSEHTANTANTAYTPSHHIQGSPFQASSYQSGAGGSAQGTASQGQQHYRFPGDDHERRNLSGGSSTGNP